MFSELINFIDQQIGQKLNKDEYINLIFDSLIFSLNSIMNIEEKSINIQNDEIEINQKNIKDIFKSNTYIYKVFIKDLKYKIKILKNNKILSNLYENQLVNAVFLNKIGNINIFEYNESIILSLFDDQKIENENFKIGKNYWLLIKKINPLEDIKNRVYVTRLGEIFIFELLKYFNSHVKNSIVKIKEIYRIPGFQSKIILEPIKKQNNIELALGFNKIKLLEIEKELNHEKLYVLEWSNKEQEFIYNVFSPVTILDMQYLEDNKLQIKVSKQQLSLAIGINGKNIKLISIILKKHITLLSD